MAGGMNGSGLCVVEAMKPRPAPPSELSFIGYALQNAEDQIDAIIGRPEAT
jgi:hypothetical protein